MQPWGPARWACASGQCACAGVPVIEPCHPGRRLPNALPPSVPAQGPPPTPTQLPSAPQPAVYADALPASDARSLSPCALQLAFRLGGFQAPREAFSLAFSPDGRWLATGAEGGLLTLYSVEPTAPPRWVHQSGGSPCLPVRAAFVRLCDGAAQRQLPRGCAPRVLGSAASGPSRWRVAAAGIGPWSPSPAAGDGPCRPFSCRLEHPAGRSCRPAGCRPCKASTTSTRRCCCPSSCGCGSSRRRRRRRQVTARCQGTRRLPRRRPRRRVSSQRGWRRGWSCK